MKKHLRISQNMCLAFLLFLLFACDNKDKVYLSDLEFGFIANEFGPPNKDLTFEKIPLSIQGKIYEKGLGVHAPSAICIDLDKNASLFHAVIGIDDEVKMYRTDSLRSKLNASANYTYDTTLDLTDHQQGATVQFKIYGDSELLFSSGWMSGVSDARTIDIDVRSVNQLCLEVDKGPDGSFADHADWADAWLEITDPDNINTYKIYSYPSDILLNQTGFLPSSPKIFRIAGSSNQKEFSVINMSGNTPVYTGMLEEKQGDWGTVMIGDFSDFQSQGDFYIKCDDKISQLFSIHRMQYIRNLDKHLNWFLWQRCGDPENGWERGQHQDDGRRLDNDKHQDVSGGWHDAADLRKWGMTVNGLWALSEIYLSLSANNDIEFAGQKDMITRIRDEIAWGNKHSHAMQEPAGYLMNQVGGDVYAHGDNNRFTDNISGTEDDRWIVTSPNAPVFQYMFIQSQCNIILAEGLNGDNPYLEKAERCYQWATKNNIAETIHEIGAAQVASLKLFEVTGKEYYYKQAIQYLNLILDSQDNASKPVNGFFREIDLSKSPPSYGSYPNSQLSYQLITPNYPVWSIVESIRAIQDPDVNQKARAAFQKYFKNFVAFFDDRSSYGIVPMALYPEDPGGSRKAGDYYYRWCYVNRENRDWWNGINPRIGYMGMILVRGGMLTNNPDAIRIGQQQLDFIYGCNPFNSSTVTGLGYNQPDFFKTSGFVPFTPETLGAVMAGIGSSDEDLPVLLPGWWQTTEYWMEAVCGNIMLLNELNQHEFGNDQQ
jgi:hypothetical protein